MFLPLITCVLAVVLPQAALSAWGYRGLRCTCEHVQL